MTRTKIEELSRNEVRICYRSYWEGDLIDETLRAPMRGGYVRDSRGQQVCEQLAGSGHTLHWSGRRPLIHMVRREYRAMRRAEARYDARLI